MGAERLFFRELAELGWKSVIYMLAAVAGSIVIVYVLTKLFMKDKGEKEV